MEISKTEYHNICGLIMWMDHLLYTENGKKEFETVFTETDKKKIKENIKKVLKRYGRRIEKNQIY